MERTYCVYKHTAPNGKVYIGITKQKPNIRFDNGEGYVKTPYFYNAIKKYGWNNIEHEILVDSIATVESASELERFYIKKYKSNQSEFGYNLTDGGAKEFHLNEEARQKRSEIAKARWENEEYRQKQSERMRGANNHMYGKKMNSESREKMSKAAKAREHLPLSDEAKKKLSCKRKLQGNFRFGTHHTEETKKKISESNKGKTVVITEETKRKISLANTGRKKSAETIERMKKASKERAKKQKKPVIKIDKRTNAVITQYESAIDAAISCGANQSTLICRCCKGLVESAYGYVWRYASGISAVGKPL